MVRLSDPTEKPTRGTAIAKSRAGRKPVRRPPPPNKNILCLSHDAALTAITAIDGPGDSALLVKTVRTRGAHARGKGGGRTVSWACMRVVCLTTMAPACCPPTHTHAHTTLAAAPHGTRRRRLVQLKHDETPAQEEPFMPYSSADSATLDTETSRVQLLNILLALRTAQSKLEGEITAKRREIDAVASLHSTYSQGAFAQGWSEAAKVHEVR